MRYKDEWERFVTPMVDVLLHDQLKSASPQNRVKILLHACTVAISYKRDEETARYFEWLTTVLQDPELYQEQLTGMQSFPIKQQQEQDDCITRSLAHYAQLLYKLLPVSGTQFLPKQTSSADFIPDVCSSPTMLKTRYALLTVIGIRWRETRDEYEAERLSDFLLQWKSRHHQENEVVERVIREITNHSFPLTRLTRAITQLHASMPSGMWSPEATLENRYQILAIARARNQKRERSSAELAILTPLNNCSDAGMSILAEEASQFAALDKRIQELRHWITPGHRSLLIDNPQPHDTKGLTCLGAQDMDIVYKSLNRVVIRMYHPKRPHDLRVKQQEYEDKLRWAFDVVLRRINTWQSKHQIQGITLQLELLTFTGHASYCRNGAEEFHSDEVKF